VSSKQRKSRGHYYKLEYYQDEEARVKDEGD